MRRAAIRDRARKRFDHGQPISGIDTRPMVFVFFLVALVFLLAAAQMRKHILLIDLPKDHPATATSFSDPPLVYRISVRADDIITLNGEAISVEGLGHWLAKFDELPRRPIIAFEPDGNASYNSAIHVLRQIKLAGLDKWSYCMTGLEKHRDFDFERFSLNTPLRLTISLDPNNRVSSEWMRPPGFKSCDPATLLPPPPHH